MADPSKWEDIIAELISEPGVAMVVGGADTGKTTFCVRLCNAGLQAGIPTAVVDADVGQSEVGAPGTIGTAMVDRPIEALSDLRPKRLYFVGATTPVSHLVEAVAGTKKMVDEAIALGTKLVVLDTSGMVSGPIGRKLKTYKADLVRPDYLIGIQKRREIEPLLMPFSKVAPVKVRLLKSSPEARRKPPEFRTARRQLNFYNHFAEAPGHIIRLDDVCFWNTWFGSGRGMKWQYVKFIEDAMKCKVLHVELVGNGIFIVSQRECRREGRTALEEQFKTRDITIVTAESFTNLLVGLADENGRTLNVGLIQAIDFKQKYMFVLSPLKTASSVRVVQFGSMRVTREGKELGIVRQGEL